MSDSVSYGLVEPFECDDPMFCMGVEWEMFRQKLSNTDATFHFQCHRDNAERLSRMCERNKRFCEVSPCPIVDGFPADHFDGWRTIIVGTKSE